MIVYLYPSHEFHYIHQQDDNLPLDNDPLLPGVLDNLDASIQAAQFSINVIDIFAPPKPILLGKWNPRALKESEAVKLKTEMISEEIRPFQFENLLKCIIDPKHVDPACVSASILRGLHEAPVLKLSEVGENELETIDLAGGRHRKRALELIKAERQDKLKRLKESLVKEEQKAQKTGADSEAVEVLSQKIEDETSYIAGLGRWGVILYEAGEYSILCIRWQNALTQNRSDASQRGVIG